MSRGRSLRILSVCDDEGIRTSRELVLKFEGYEVESVSCKQEMDPAELRSFHIAILCHSIPPERATVIAARFRRFNPAIGIIRVHATHPAVDQAYDVDCEVLPGPGQLLNGVRSLAARLRSRGQFYPATQHRLA